MGAGFLSLQPRQEPCALLPRLFVQHCWTPLACSLIDMCLQMCATQLLSTLPKRNRAIVVGDTSDGAGLHLQAQSSLSGERASMALAASPA